MSHDLFGEVISLHPALLEYSALSSFPGLGKISMAQFSACRTKVS